jgi:hypothetical protein
MFKVIWSPTSIQFFLAIDTQFIPLQTQQLHLIKISFLIMNVAMEPCLELSGGQIDPAFTQSSMS